MAEALQKLEAEHDGREAHDHLMAECPWYRHVDSGGRDHPDLHCRHQAEGEGGALVKFTPRTPEASTVVKPTVPPGGPGLFHVKGMHLPPYIEHLYPHLVARYGKHDAYGVAVGIVKKWAAGVNPGGWKTKSGKGKRTHPDVRAAAAKNVAEWEKDKAAAHEHSEAKAAAGELEGLELAAMTTAPGARPAPVTNPSGGNYAQYGLHQHPAATISPSPPLPPDVALPTAAEVKAVIALVPDCSKPELADTARKFLEQAAGKIERGNPIEALGVLRSAQAALYAGHKADISELMPSVYTANVFAQVPPGEQSSATAAMKQGTDRRLAWRKAEMATQALAERIRKKFFHGVYNGPTSLGRFTTEDDMTALDKVLALAGAPVTTGKDVSFPTVSDVSGRTPLIEPPEDLLGAPTGKAAEELAGLPTLDKARVTAYLDRARAMLATNRSGAAQSALRAAVIAHESGARHLARHIKAHVQALAEMGNVTKAGPQAGVMSAGGKTVSPQNSRQTTADTGNRTPATGLSAVQRLELASVGAGKAKSGGSAWLPEAAWKKVEHAQDAAAKSKAAAKPVPGARPTPPPGTVIRSSGAPPGEPGPGRRPSAGGGSGRDPHQLHELHTEHLEHLHRLHVLHQDHVEHMKNLGAQHFGG
jgi:hypothetical protein